VDLGAREACIGALYLIRIEAAPWMDLLNHLEVFYNQPMRSLRKFLGDNLTRVFQRVTK
jgi:hypothetical protein